MKETSMMFRPELVRAILDGRKTQTRREVKNLINDFDHCDKMRVIETGESFYRFSLSVDGVTTTQDVDCPWRVGDRLYVQEAAIKIGHERTGKNGQYLWPKLSASFTETDARRWFDQSCVYTLDLRRDDPVFSEPHGNLNKMFMPRWASRIVLEITDVRVERLAMISDDDSLAEGVATERQRDSTWYGGKGVVMFRALWDSINGAGSFDLSPWVWVIAFKRIES